MIASYQTKRPAQAQNSTAWLRYWCIPYMPTLLLHLP